MTCLGFRNIVASYFFWAEKWLEHRSWLCSSGRDAEFRHWSGNQGPTCSRHARRGRKKRGRAKQAVLLSPRRLSSPGVSGCRRRLWLSPFEVGGERPAGCRGWGPARLLTPSPRPGTERLLPFRCQGAAAGTEGGRQCHPAQPSGRTWRESSRRADGLQWEGRPRSSRTPRFLSYIRTVVSLRRRTGKLWGCSGHPSA